MQGQKTRKRLQLDFPNGRSDAKGPYTQCQNPSYVGGSKYPPVVFTVMFETSRSASDSDESHKSERKRDNEQLNILTKCAALSSAGRRDIERMGSYSFSDLE